MQIEFLKCMKNFHDKSLFREYLAAVNNGLNGISRKASTKLKEMERNKTSPYHTQEKTSGVTLKKNNKKEKERKGNDNSALNTCNK